MISAQARARQLAALVKWVSKLPADEPLETLELAADAIAMHRQAVLNALNS